MGFKKRRKIPTPPLLLLEKVTLDNSEKYTFILLPSSNNNELSRLSLAISASNSFDISTKAFQIRDLSKIKIYELI